MKRFTTFFIAILLSLMTVTAGDTLSLSALHDMSNRMQHNDFLQEALLHDSLLKATSSARWLQTIQVMETDSLALACMPTLYDMVMTRYINSTHSQRRDSLIEEWVNFHANDTNLLARAYVLSYKNTSEHLRLYNSLPDCWERGLLLRTFLIGSTHQNQEQALDILETYIAKYPQSPFNNELRSRADHLLRMSLSFSAPDCITTTDSLSITYNITNAHQVIWRINRQNRRRTCIDSCVTRIDSHARLTNLTEQHVSFPPLPPGRYNLTAELVEDTLNDKHNRTSRELCFSVSDLCCFSYAETANKKHHGVLHTVVTDAISGQPVRGAIVTEKRYRIKQQHCTNSDGHASFRLPKGWSYVSSYAHKRKHYSASASEHNYYGGGAAIQTYPNATIFRPGDTLQLAVVCTYSDINRCQTISDESIHFELYKNGKLLDTTLVTDAYGEVCLSMPIPDDWKLGTYLMYINSQRDNHYSRKSFAFDVEDYRLPTFEIVLSPDNHNIQVGDASATLRGRAHLFSGLPMVNQTINGTIACLGYRQPFTCTTSFDGSFQYEIPDTLLREKKAIYLSTECTSADGETHHANQYILIRDTLSSAQAAASQYTTPDPWPENQPLWVEQDSILYLGDTMVSVLVGTRQENPVYVIVSSRQQLEQTRWQTLPAGLHRLNFDLPTDTNNYLDIRFVTTIHSNVYSEQVHATAPLRTELHLVPVSFRNYLRPGVEEQWQWQLHDQQGLPVQGRLLFTMLDEAVYSLSRVWYNQPAQFWNTSYTVFNFTNPSNSTLSIRSKLPERSEMQIDELTLYEPYHAIGDTAMFIKIRGTVVNKATKEKIFPAAIIAEGTTIGTTTDYNGTFSLYVHTGAQLTISAIGYKTVTLPAQSNMYISLEADDTELYETVVTGYGSPVSVRGVSLIQGRSLDKRKANYYEEEMEVTEDNMETLSLVANEEEEPSEEITNDTPMRDGDTRLAIYTSGIQSDSLGLIHYRFRTPPDNTRWHLLGIAWTPNGASQRMDTILTATRTLMMHLTIPRFLRQGDQVVLPCVIRNTADSLRHIILSADIRCAQTDSLIYSLHTDTTIVAGGEMIIPIPCHTTHLTQALIVRASVVGNDGSSDGEQRLLPVLSCVEPVKEGIPFYFHPGKSSQHITLPSVPSEATDASLVLSYCDNPLAYLFHGLPAAVDTSYATILPMAHHLFTLLTGNLLANRYPGYRDLTDTYALVKALRKFQRADGGFSWLGDVRSCPSTSITLQWVYLMGELQSIGAMTSDLKHMTERAIHYLDRTYHQRIQEDEKRAKKQKKALDYSAYDMYVFARSYFPDVALDTEMQPYYENILDAMEKSSNLIVAPYQALCMERSGRHAQALHLIEYLRQHNTTSPEQGMYFHNLPIYSYWFSQCEQQATYLRAFAAVDPRKDEIDALRQWLLLSNQATDWGRSSLSAYAASALLLSGDEWLQAAQDSTNKTGLTIDTIPYTHDYTSPHYRIQGQQMTIQTSDSATHPTWGSAMVYYQTPIQNVQPYAQKAMAIKRQYTLIRGSKETPLTESAVLKKGDHVRVSLTITLDREMDGIILRDHKPATLEPTQATSGYQWQPMKEDTEQEDTFWSGVLSYVQFKNEEVNVYIDHLPSGTYTHSYDCYVTTSGTTLSGLATAESELAPEYNAHTAILPLQTR